MRERTERRHGPQRALRGKRDALRGRHADAQPGERARTGTDRDGVEIVRADRGADARGVDQQEQIRAVAAAVASGLGEHAPVLDDRDARDPGRGIDAEDDHGRRVI